MVHWAPTMFRHESPQCFASYVVFYVQPILFTRFGSTYACFNGSYFIGYNVQVYLLMFT